MPMYECMCAGAMFANVCVCVFSSVGQCFHAINPYQIQLNIIFPTTYARTSFDRIAEEEDT